MQYMCKRVYFHAAECGCLPACAEVSYDVVYSLSKWPASGFETDLLYMDTFIIRNFTHHFASADGKRDALVKHVKNKTRDVIMRDFARLNIYVANSNVKRTVEQPDYTFNQLVSDIGGQLGIWVGISIITLAECLELFFRLLRHVFKAKLQHLGDLDLEQGQSEAYAMTSTSHVKNSDDEKTGNDDQGYHDVYILREKGCVLLPCVARSRSVRVERVHSLPPFDKPTRSRNEDNFPSM